MATTALAKPPAAVDTLDAAVIERGMRAHHWHRPTVWWIDHSRTAVTPGISANVLLGVFARKSFDMNLSMPEPLPHESANMTDSDGKALPLWIEGNVKEHQTITSLQMRPMGFELRWSANGPNANNPYAYLINGIAASEIYRRSCPGPRPSFESSVWLQHMEGYEPFLSSLCGYWTDVLNKEVCVQFPQLSFVFGTSHNPINPLLMPPSINSKKSAPVASTDASRPTAAHLTEEARSVYFLMVLLQCWMSVNGRFAVQTTNSATRPVFVAALDCNDCTADFKGNLDVADATGPMFEESKAHGNPYPEPCAYRPKGTSSPPTPLETLLSKDPVLDGAWKLASMARHLNFGRFVDHVDKVFRTATGYSLVSRSNMDTMKKNIPSAFGGRGFVFASTPNLLELYREGMFRAASHMNTTMQQSNKEPEVGGVDDASSDDDGDEDAPPPSSTQLLKAHKPKTPTKRRHPFKINMKEYKASRPYRTNNDNHFLKLNKISEMTFKSKSVIPAQSGRMMKFIECDHTIQTPPVFMAHTHFSPTRPIARFDLSYATTASGSGRIDPTVCWMIAHFMTQGDTSAFGKHLVKNSFVVNAKSDNANITRYFRNPANEPVLCRQYGARTRYRTYRDERPGERYVHYCQIPRVAPVLRTDPTKHAHGVKPASASASTTATATSTINPLPEAAYKGIIDPSTQYPDTLMQYYRLQRRRYHSGDKLTVATVNQYLAIVAERCTDLKRLFGDRDPWVLSDGPGSLHKVSLFDIYMAMANEMPESYIWFLLMTAEMAVVGKELQQTEAGLLFALERLSIRWSQGMDVLGFRKKLALQKIGYNNDDPQDRNVIRGVYNAFLPENPTYNPAAETIVRANVEFDRRFFVPSRVRAFLLSEHFVLRSNDVKSVSFDTILEDVVTALCNSVCRKAELVTSLTPNLLALLFTKDGSHSQRICSGILATNGTLGNKYIGMHLFQHIIDLYIERIKHPIFCFAAYVCHPPIGAISSLTGCEWVKPNSTPRTTRPTAAAAAAEITLPPDRPSTPSAFLVPRPKGSPTSPQTPASLRTHPSPSSKLIISTNSRDSTATNSSDSAVSIPLFGATAPAQETYTTPFQSIKDRVQPILSATVRKKNLRVDDYLAPQNYQTIADMCIALHMTELANHIPVENNKRQRMEHLFKCAKEHLVRRLIDRLGFRSESLQLKSEGPPLDAYSRALLELKQTQFIADDVLYQLYRLKSDVVNGEKFDATKSMAGVAADVKRLCDEDKVLYLKFDRYVSDKNQRPPATASASGSSNSIPFIVFGTPHTQSESVAITICNLILRLLKRGSSLG